MTRGIRCYDSFHGENCALTGVQKLYFKFNFRDFSFAHPPTLWENLLKLVWKENTGKKRLIEEHGAMNVRLGTVVAVVTVVTVYSYSTVDAWKGSLIKLRHGSTIDTRPSAFQIYPLQNPRLWLFPTVHSQNCWTDESQELGYSMSHFF